MLVCLYVLASTIVMFTEMLHEYLCMYVCMLYPKENMFLALKKDTLSHLELVI